MQTAERADKRVCTVTNLVRPKKTGGVAFCCRTTGEAARPSRPMDRGQPATDVYDVSVLPHDDAKDCSGNRGASKEDEHENVDQGGGLPGVGVVSVHAGPADRLGELQAEREPRGRRHQVYVMLDDEPPGNGDDADSGGTALAVAQDTRPGGAGCLAPRAARPGAAAQLRTGEQCEGRNAPVRKIPPVVAPVVEGRTMKPKLSYFSYLDQSPSVRELQSDVSDRGQ